MRKKTSKLHFIHLLYVEVNSASFLSVKRADTAKRIIKIASHAIPIGHESSKFTMKFLTIFQSWL